MDQTTNGVIITDAIKFVQTNKEKLTKSAKEEDNGKESKEPDYDEDKNLEGRQEEETGEEETNVRLKCEVRHLPLTLLNRGVGSKCRTSPIAVP